jgi:SRSO17 transposase
MSTQDVVRTISVSRQERLREASRRIFAPLPRADQRRWAEVYLTGLLAAHGRKSIRNIALASAEIEQPAAMQALQQFVNQSPWDWQLIREALAQDVAVQLPPRAWNFQKVILPKRGSHSVGVGRRFVPSMGRTINCQLGVGAFLTGGGRSVPVDWRLVLDGAWIRDNARRQRTRVPDLATGASVAAHVLDMVDTMTEVWKLPAAPVVADAMSSLRDARELARGLSERQLDFLLEISASTEVTDGPQRSGPQPAVVRNAMRASPGRPLTAQDHLAGSAFGRPQLITVGNIHGRVYNLHVAPTLVGLPEVQENYRLFTYRCPVTQENKVWLTNILDRRMERITDLILQRCLGERELGRLEEHFGIRDFEGRSYPGWHHHMTLVSAAYAFDILDREHAGRALQYTG